MIKNHCPHPICLSRVSGLHALLLIKEQSLEEEGEGRQVSL